MDLPVELRNNFKHYYNNITVTTQHDFTVMARAPLALVRSRATTLLKPSASELILVTGGAQAEFFKVLHVAGFLKICSPFHLEDAPSECFFP